MKCSTILILIFLLTSCNKMKNNEQTEADKFWTKYLEALKKMNTEYLIENSFDSIQCGDCAIESINPSEFYNSREFFNNHFDKLMNRAIYQSKYSIYDNNDTVRINYNLGNSNRIYTLVKIENKYKFHGTFPVP